MRIAIIIAFTLVSQFCIGQNTNVKIETDRALGGIVDYNPSLIHFIFDQDEIDMMIQNQVNNEANTAVQSAAKRLDIPKKSQSVKPFSKAPVRQLADSDDHKDELALNAPNFVRGYIILANSHTKAFRSYELYEQSGMLIGKGPLARKKTIRVPWEAEGEINLMLHGVAGSQTFQFMAAP